MSPYKHIIDSKILLALACAYKVKPSVTSMLQYLLLQKLSNFKVGIFSFAWLIGGEAASLRKSRKLHFSAYFNIYLTLCTCSNLPTLPIHSTEYNLHNLSITSIYLHIWYKRMCVFQIFFNSPSIIIPSPIPNLQ